jgi:hypothetical protein
MGAGNATARSRFVPEISASWGGVDQSVVDAPRLPPGESCRGPFALRRSADQLGVGGAARHLPDAAGLALRVGPSCPGPLRSVSRRIARL